MNKHRTVKLSIVLVTAMMAFFFLRASAGQAEGARGVLRQLTDLVAPRLDRANRQLTGVAAPASDRALPATPRVVPLAGNHLAMASLASAGQVVTQTFTLQAGWNTIYLEVEPSNSSPLVGVGLLFSAGWSSQLESDLDAGNLPDALRQTFDNNGITLSDRISVTKPEDDYWLISDDGEMISYAVFKEVENGESVLKVYSAALYEQSTIEAVFGALACDACLESVWKWNVPQSTMDYIIDPAEGLWDEPGWKRYFPETSLGPDDLSREFLTDLLSLHANTGYLVKLKDDAGDVELTVSGTPVARNHLWLKGSYNLAGFPIDPDAPPTVGTFFQALQNGPSPITEVRALGSDGRWGVSLSPGDVLNHSQAYLVYYDDQDPDAPDDYTAPLNIVDGVLDELQFSRGWGGGKQSLTIENLSSSDATVTVALVDGANAAVALRYVDETTDPETQVDLRANMVEITLAAGDAERLEFVVLSTEQAGDGAALLQLFSADLGTRWLIPLSAESGSLAGLWIGDVVVNDVSQARLGATNVVSGALTIELRQRDESGIRGAAELTEIPSGDTASVAMTVTLAFPELEDTVVPQVITGTAPYISGYVYEDTNQNGQPDASDGAFEGVTVTLESGAVTTHTVTADDGSYLFEGLDPDTYALTLDQQPPAGYTDDFDVTPPVEEMDAPEPATEPNIWPVEVTVDDDGVTRIEYDDGTIDDDFPRYDAEDSRVEPELNFGYVTTYDASLWTGVCADRLEKRRDLDPVVNGILETELNSAALNQGYDVDDQLLGGSSQYVIYVEEQGGAGEAGQGIACGEIVVGAPTRFEDGQGSDFTFRLLLRVDENGTTELLPYYEVEDGPRVSSAALSIEGALVRSGTVDFGDTSGLLDFFITIDPQDPLNPFKHKYQPDHDNLDVKFNEIDFDAVDPYLWEAPEIRRRIQLELTELPPYSGEDVEELAAEVDWGGATWGGLYKEVIKGIHKNDITVKGYFVIRHALMAEELEDQPYD
ncbi:MAG: hypothetical protein H8D78_09455 [Chloroflexi bacterium]|nr:hypothetical protein [Chloroflexota bacterium]